MRRDVRLNNRFCAASQNKFFDVIFLDFTACFVAFKAQTYGRASQRESLLFVVVIASLPRLGTFRISLTSSPFKLVSIRV